MTSNVFIFTAYPVPPLCPAFLFLTCCVPPLAVGVYHNVLFISLYLFNFLYAMRQEESIKTAQIQGSKVSSFDFSSSFFK